jgi:hypothetical protein
MEKRLLVAGAEWPAWLHLDGWAGATKQAVMVVGETPKRYRIRAVDGEAVRLAGRRRISQAETALVPKHAVTRRDG